jgi:hypothetical protein
MITKEMIATKAFLEDQEFTKLVVTEFVKNGVEAAINLATTYMVRKGYPRQQAYMVGTAYCVGFLRGIMLTEAREQRLEKVKDETL